MRIRVITLLTAIVILSLIGCSKTTDETTVQEKENKNTYQTVKANEEGNVVIDTTNISKDATFVNYETADGTIIQFIVVKASDGSIRTTFNTCQACNPAPKAYFEQKGDTFVCQNCGNVFRTDQVGIEKGGCNPANIEEREQTDQSVIISASYIDQYAGNFSTWKGPTQ